VSKQIFSGNVVVKVELLMHISFRLTTLLCTGDSHCRATRIQGFVRDPK